MTNVSHIDKTKAVFIEAGVNVDRQYYCSQGPSPQLAVRSDNVD